MTGRETMKLGFILHGNGVGWNDWRHPNAEPGANIDFRYYKKQAILAETAKLDFLFIADSLFITHQSSPLHLNRFEPVTILSALAAVTDHIGLVGTVSVSYTEPFTVARQFLSLDQISGGRVGWNVVTSWLAESASNFGRTGHPSHAVRYQIAAEFIDVVKGLWDSWEEDAFVHDKASGQFFDPEKLHTLNHEGTYFSVKGPLNVARSPQGQPVIFQAGASESGLNFAAEHADAIFVHHQGIDGAKAYYEDIKARAAHYGRDPEKLLILPGLQFIIGSTEEEAEAKYQAFSPLASIDDCLRMLGRFFNDHDFSQYPLDDPFPDVEHIGIDSLQSAVLTITRAARRDKLTLRQVAARFGIPILRFIGTPEGMADLMET